MPYPSVFQGDLFQPEQIPGVTVYQADLKPGELIYIPQKWPHQVVSKSVLCCCHLYL